MEHILLDGGAFVDKATTHALLKEQLQLPDYYGNNLDALWDCLVSDFTPKMITIRNPQRIVDNLGRYGQSLLRLFEELKEQNEEIRIVFAYDV